MRRGKSPTGAGVAGQRSWVLGTDGQPYKNIVTAGGNTLHRAVEIVANFRRQCCGQLESDRDYV